jgi:hypothetical protein
MANSVFYGALLETEEKSLKARLGTIQPRTPGAPDEELPGE